MTAWLTEHWMLLVPLVLGAVAIAGLLPQPGQRSRLFAALIGLVALASAGALWLRPTGAIVHDIVFYLFAATAVVSAVLMITNHNPVYAALWFALVTLATCGLFLLSSAPFLAAATVIVYAGAIIVTFLFVIMLAQQAGTTIYDRQARDPYLATLGAFVLLGGLLFTLQEWSSLRNTGSGRVAAAATDAVEGTPRGFLPPPAATNANPFSRSETGDVGLMRGVGRSLFGDYLFAVEIAGTLLLIAVIGAIAVAPRRSRGTL